MLDFLLKEVPREFWFLMEEMAIYLLLGFAVAGLLSAFISPEIIERHLGGRGQQPIRPRSSALPCRSVPAA